MNRFTYLVAVVIAGLVIGCKEEVSSTSLAVKKTEYKFGIIAKSNDNPVFQAAHKGANDAAADLGKKYGITIHIDWRTPPQEDAQQQASYVGLLTAAGVDGIGISCSDATLVTKAIDDAIAAGIPVMCWDSDAPQSKRFCYHGVDNVECGKQLADATAEVMGRKGVIAVLAGNQTATNLQARVRGVREGIAKYPDMKIKEVYYHVETPQDAASRVEQVQTTNPDIQGWAMIGGWALFSDAIRKNPAFAGGKIKIVSIDALPECLPYIDQGVAQELLHQKVYEWGYRAVEILYDKVASGKVPPNGMDISTMEPVTKANVEHYRELWKTRWNPNL